MEVNMGNQHGVYQDNLMKEYNLRLRERVKENDKTMEVNTDF